MPQLETLKHRAEFLAVNSGARSAKPAFVVLARERAGAGTPGPVRLGLTVSRKNGNAVARNRIRRRLRALARATLDAKGRAGWDYVLIGRTTALTLDFAAMARDLESALEMLHKAPAPGAARDPAATRGDTLRRR
jgi:ribonuclease P protein component